MWPEPRRLQYSVRSRAALPAALLLLGAALACPPARADDEEPSATPYRPTVSNPADLSAPGHFEWEAGAQRILGDDRAREDALPFLLKYAFDENVGVLVGGSAWVRQTDPAAATLSGLGDSFVALKLRHAVNAGSALGLELGVLLPSARSGLGSSKLGCSTNAIYSTDLGDLHLDLNAGAQYLGDAAGGVSHWQYAWAGALSRPLNERIGAALELSGNYQRGSGDSSQALGALSYNLSRRVVLDAGGAYGLTHHAHDRTLFFGATWLL